MIEISSDFVRLLQEPHGVDGGCGFPAIFAQQFRDRGHAFGQLGVDIHYRVTERVETGEHRSMGRKCPRSDRTRIFKDSSLEGEEIQAG